MKYLSLSRFLFLLFITFLSCFACAEDTKHINLGTNYKYFRFEIENDDKNFAAYITPEPRTTSRIDALRPIRFIVTPLSLLPGQNLRLLLRPVINPNANVGEDPQFDLSNHSGFTITVADNNYHGSDRQTEHHFFQTLRVFTPSILDEISRAFDPLRTQSDAYTAPVPAQLNLNDPVELRGAIEGWWQPVEVNYIMEGQEEVLCYALSRSDYVKEYDDPDRIETATIKKLDADEIEGFEGEQLVWNWFIKGKKDDDEKDPGATGSSGCWFSSLWNQCASIKSSQSSGDSSDNKKESALIKSSSGLENPAQRKSGLRHRTTDKQTRIRGGYLYKITGLAHYH